MLAMYPTNSKDYLERLARNADLLYTLISDLLDANRIDRKLSIRSLTKLNTIRNHLSVLRYCSKLEGLCKSFDIAQMVAVICEKFIIRWTRRAFRVMTRKFSCIHSHWI